MDREFPHIQMIITSSWQGKRSQSELKAAKKMISLFLSCSKSAVNWTLSQSGVSDLSRTPCDQSNEGCHLLLEPAPIGTKCFCWEDLIQHGCVCVAGGAINDPEL